jgi:hypothetical protein
MTDGLNAETGTREVSFADDGTDPLARLTALIGAGGEVVIAKREICGEVHTLAKIHRWGSPWVEGPTVRPWATRGGERVELDERTKNNLALAGLEARLAS